MSLDKVIKYKKEKRKQYRDIRLYDRTCRCHGSCDWCRRNRFYQQNKMLRASRYRLKEYSYEESL